VLTAVDEARTGVASGVNNAIARVAGLMAIAVLGIFMVNEFGASLGERLADVDLPVEVAHTLEMERDRLAALRLPLGVDPALNDMVESAVDRSFVAGFRRVVLICGGLGLTSVVAAAMTIRGPNRDSA
jgi:hypothetical protein